MLTAKPTVTIVHGAWQPIESWKVFAENTETLGHETEIVPLPSIDGDETPLPGLREDYEAVAAVLARQADEGKEIVLLCHSYGGVVGSCAVEGLDLASRKKAGKKGGVLIIVYMTAFMLPKGKSLLEALGGVPAPWMDVQGDKIYVVKSSVKEMAFNDGMSDEDIELYSSHLRHSAVAAFATPSVYEPWSNGIPCSYIFCEIDNCITLPVQQMMASQLGPGALTFSLKAGHVPFISFPQESADAIVKAAAEGIRTRDL